ncbi:cytochrome C oxidase subunit II [Pseudolabrys sp. Root1462]|uniref:leucyl aminopeptidase family protein n=1 Tax=Pseudolabrys sp. Root1462 TaxID=1736466 RepID=UPI0007033D30|nr:leucyl aminopeptidase family protein [Pseudolabrys sp. Root1462]KQY97238.1 cytochrome C oxidase subunit II [Pseudolabrys sp. Root1462]
MHPVFAAGETRGTPIWFVHAGNAETVLAGFGDRERAFAAAAGFEAKPGKLLLIPALDGKLAGVLFGLEKPGDLIDTFRPGALVNLLPAGTYRFANAPHDARLAALAFATGAYQFTRYRKGDARKIKLVVPKGVDGEEVGRIAEGVALARDLTNTPANDMGPEELEAAARKLAAAHGAKIQVTSGDKLAKEFPLIHAVGMGSPRAPRLIDITWGKDKDPKVTLVGKGVCFDTGGLDIKPSSGMLNMKKDMGGAASVLGLAHMIMAGKMKLRLRVLIPAVENSISGRSFRPRDVYASRKGLTVEIGNTDAEGRLVLADALTLASEDKPALIADFATLTGAARVALGASLPALFSNDDKLAADMGKAGLAENDPVWRLPLWQPYEAQLDSKVSDINNIGSDGFGGAIIAALFLKKFVDVPSWVHFDIFAWTPSARPGRPEGAELMAARALYGVLCARYG